MSERKPSPKFSPEAQPTERANPGLLDAILASATEYALITTEEDGKIATWNRGAQQVFGYAPQEIVGKSLEELFTEPDKINGKPKRELDVARDTGRSSDVRWHRRKDGSWFWAEGVMTTIKEDDGNIIGYLKILRDETERKNALMKIEELARVDMLTGVANRTAFNERLSEMMATAARSHELMALHLLDLDNFKQVNDRWGHPVGDKLLMLVTQRMREVTRDTDFIARLGGDEFVILQANVATPEAGGRLAEKLVQTMSMPFDIDGRQIATGASIGIALFPRDATEPDHLLRKADLALYKVKHDSRNGYHYFSEQLDTDSHNKGNLLAALKRATQDHSFWLAYQPEIDVATGQIIAVEALLRCRDPLLAECQVDDIIALATQSGLMPEIGLWVMNEACTQNRKWQDAGFSPIKMCVNLCPGELNVPDFVERVQRILQQSNLSPRHLEVEVTEREVFEAAGEGPAAIVKLRALGVSVAIDDFGTGYSVLSRLRNLPINKLKLDQSFVSQIPADPDSCAIAKAMIGLAHTLRLEIIAEGAESVEQAAFLEREQCETMQGYFFSRPLDAGDMTDWLADRARSTKAHHLS
jgi:diguanylate cyclase (GGDEF)-like protein/PAS domain S-box-containing protein